MKMPVVFSGHGSPMVAFEDNNITREMKRVGDDIISTYGKPKAILAISAHWYTRGTFVQTTQTPKQIYDMYGFPKELYEVKYPARGCADLSNRVLELLGGDVKANDDWGIDHGTWTVLCHMFPAADIPVVQLSVDGTIDRKKIYEIGEKISALRISALRDEGYLIFGSGNVVHNLRRVEWNNPNGSKECVAFNNAFVEALEKRDDEKMINYEAFPHWKYAVPTPEHYLPIIYLLGAAKSEKATVFNNECNLGSIAMTGFISG